jgi:hypothetical protein
MLHLRSIEDMNKYRGKLRGAIVLPFDPTFVDRSALSDSPYQGVPAGPAEHAPESAPEDRVPLLRALSGMIAQEGVGAMLLDSAKLDGLFNMSDTYIAGKSVGYDQPEFPIAFITHEDYGLLSRLQASAPVTMKVRLDSTASADSVPSAVTVAEIKGSEFPQQRVVVGGHLDSWDLGQGALDNGAGAVAVMEAARALKALRWAPKRTITFVLFTGEEEGGTGATAFLNSHAADIPDMDAALILDSGTGRVMSIALENLWETGPLMSEIYGPLKDVFRLWPLDAEYIGQSDHIFFLRKGVPAYYCVQAPAHYGEAHHSQADTLDLVLPDDINQGAALLASWSWNVSEMPATLPHHAPEEPKNK